MIRFYYGPGANPPKVALFLEEAGLPYEVVPIDTHAGEQFSPDFLAINPNGKVPALVDDRVAVFDSSAILLHLAEKTNTFYLPPGRPDARPELLSWLMFIASGLGPFTGQAAHFLRHAAAQTYAVNRYRYEMERHWTIVQKRLADRRYMMGDAYTILDMSVWAWAGAVPVLLGKAAWETQYPDVKRLFDEINARPAVARVRVLSAKYPVAPETPQARAVLYPQNPAAGV